ncbi:MAG: hypothetical protein NC093_01215 [Alistipes sp.]|nr:hypothetical protein [Alistipes sp.]
MNLHEIYSAAQLASNNYAKQASEVYSQLMLDRSALGYTAKNLLKNTAVSQTKNGVTFTVNTDGSLSANGTSTADTEVIINDWTDFPQNMKNNNMIITGCPSGGSGSSYRIAVHSKKNASESYSGLGADTGEGFVFNTSNQFVRIILRIGKNITMNGLTFYPMLRYANITDSDYEPYKPSVNERLAALESASVMSSNSTDSDHAQNTIYTNETNE